MDMHAEGGGDALGGGMDPEKEREARERSEPGALVLHETITLQGNEELARSVSSVAWSGFASGLTMGFTLIAQGVLYAHLPDSPWRDLVTGFGYTLGFLLVTLGKQQLFTETTLTVLLPLLHSPERIWTVMRFWLVVFVTNVLATLLIAWAISVPGVFADEFRQAFEAIAMKSSQGSFGVTLARAVLAGWLIALMVWVSPAVGSARLLLIVAVTYFLPVAELKHVIAGSVEVAYGAITGGLTWATYFAFVASALIGNSIGGIVFVGLLNHAQVRQEL
jgi:formate/nitrite transporter FocA (FNT family)